MPGYIRTDPTVKKEVKKSDEEKKVKKKRTRASSFRQGPMTQNSSVKLWETARKKRGLRHTASGNIFPPHKKKEVNNNMAKQRSITPGIKTETKGIGLEPTNSKVTGGCSIKTSDIGNEFMKRGYDVWKWGKNGQEDARLFFGAEAGERGIIMANAGDAREIGG